MRYTHRMFERITSRLKNTTLLLRIKRASIQPVNRLLSHKRMSTLESQWQNAANARDMLFITRVASRYRAYRKSDHELPLLPQRGDHVTIAPEAWEALYQPRRTHKREAEIDIILPITHSYDIALPALYTLLTSDNQRAFRVVVLLSQHPDHKLTDKLRRLQELDLFDLLVDNGEEGMIGLINFAFQRHDTRDIVLFSSHIECTDGWLDRLYDAAARSPATTATVSPWLTAGGATGYPDNEGSIAHALEATAILDDICQELFADTIPESLPSPSAHALYIRRDALHSIGLLTERASITAALSAWSALAREKGFEHLWAQNILLGTSPAYLPPHAARTVPIHHREQAERIDRARLAHQCHDNTLVIEGIRPNILPAPSNGQLHLMPDPHIPENVRLGLPDIRLYPHLSFPIDSGFDTLMEICTALGIRDIIVRQPAGFPSRMVEWISFFSQQAQIPYRLTISDDYLICPGLIGVAKTCTPEDLESSYRSFNLSYPLDSDGIPLWLWRVRSAGLIEHAQSLQFTDKDIRALFERYFSIT